jgi:uncharacterized membrane protein YdbT with pleckstrin-like domain
MMRLLPAPEEYAVNSGSSEKLGGEFWFVIVMLPISLFFAYLGFATGSGRNLFGSLVVTAILLWRVYDLIQKTRLARLMRENPGIQRIYESSDRE